MDRRLLLRGAFPKSADEYIQHVERLLQLRRAELDEKWGKLEEKWAAHNERMVRFGLASRTDEEGVIELNVGGLNVTVCWHLLAAAEGFEDSVLGALLEGAWGKGRIPRDADGRIVLDESPVCIKHILAQTTLNANGRSSTVAVAADEAPCLIYTAHVMGLPGPVLTHHPKYLNMCGGSTVLEAFEIAPFGAKIREWVGDSTAQMTLIYRATRDGFDTKAFKPRCSEDRPHSVSLIRVRSDHGNEDDSVVGGYSVLPWSCSFGGVQFITAQTFVFMLKSSSATAKVPSKPTKWNPHPCKVGHKFTTTKDDGTCVGGSDLYTTLDATSGGCTLQTGRTYFDIKEDSPFLAFNGKKVVDVEVYRYSTPVSPATAAPSTTKPGGDPLTEAEAYDIRSLGETIASSLMEERVVLDRAVKEMEAAGSRVSAAVGALETVYGPSVAAGEQDAVVELNVRGTRMTTLRSTLQACPRSALATMFDEERWPATDKDKDEHGRRLIDCNPACFSKILDVLRMRKRASWKRGTAGRGKQEEGEEEEESKEEEGAEESSNGGSGAVLVKEYDVEALGDAVNMYFPGCEGFITDLVQPVCSGTDTR
ncbi:unnamed protein product, partial [Laminaria digitata]